MDDMSPEEILAQAQAAAREAAVELAMRKPNSKVTGFKLLCNIVTPSHIKWSLPKLVNNGLTCANYVKSE